MPAEVTYGDIEDAALDAAGVVAGFLPEPYRSAVVTAIRVTTKMLRPDLVVIEASADTVVTAEAE